MFEELACDTTFCSDFYMISRWFTCCRRRQEALAVTLTPSAQNSSTVVYIFEHIKVIFRDEYSIVLISLLSIYFVRQSQPRGIFPLYGDAHSLKIPQISAKLPYLAILLSNQVFVMILTNSESSFRRSITLGKNFPRGNQRTLACAFTFTKFTILATYVRRQFSSVDIAFVVKLSLCIKITWYTINSRPAKQHLIYETIG